MGGIDQARRDARITTPLGDNALVLYRLEGGEALGEPFDYRLDCLSEDDAIDLDDLLGKGITVAFDTHEDGTRHIDGIVTRAAQVSGRTEYAQYRFSVRPRLWLLERTSDCRIFSETSVPDIVLQVLGEHGVTAVDVRLSESYSPRHYCVQYRETAFAFVSRLLEHEGIHYFFEHGEGEHVLVLADGPEAHGSLPGYERVPHYTADQGRRERDHLTSWSFRRSVDSGRYVMNDFAFDEPARDLLVSASIQVTEAYDEFELYEYPGAFPGAGSGAMERSYGEGLARRRMELELSRHEVSKAGGNARGLAAGRTFELSGAERAELDREYLIVRAGLSIDLDSYFSGGDGGAPEFDCRIECIDARTVFRPARRTSLPRIQGPQTAIVAGPAGEEIWTDKHGRVKLQFHWDRYGQSNENSSRWVRVSQAWAGAQWGAIHLPRIGQEVIVEYIDGDPDRPIVTGRVYNGTHGVPYHLPANATQSGIKSRSSSGGQAANFNEIRMEDKKGAEELYVHAEKNQTNVVENDESTSVGNDETISIGNDRIETVGNDETISIGNDRTETVGNDETISIGSDRTETVGSDEKISIGSNRTETVGADEDVTIGGRQAVTVRGDVVEKYASNQDTSVGGNHTESIGKGQELKVADDRKVTVGDDLVVSVGKNLRITAGDSISIVTGKASIKMKKDGSIVLNGVDVTVNGKGKVDVKAKNNVVMKGKKILQN